MYEDFSEEACQVMQHAQSEARKFGLAFLGSEEILLGLLHPTNLAHRALTENGFTLHAARKEFDRLIGTGSENSSIEPALTPRAKLVITRSDAERERMGELLISPLHLLLGLLSEGGGTAITILKNLTGNLDTLRATAIDLAIEEGSLKSEDRETMLQTIVNGHLTRRCKICGETNNRVAIRCKYCYEGFSEEHYTHCTYCAESIRRTASKCGYCQSRLQPAQTI